MTPAEAAQLLDLPPGATPEEVELRFQDLRRRLEDKVVKAPTPGLQAKYRETLAAITEAHGVMLRAGGGAELPVVRRENGEGRMEKGRGVEAGGTGRETGDRRPEAGNQKSGNRPVALVAIGFVLVAVLAAGGWWYAQHRAEQARQAEVARVAAEQARLEQERLAAAERERVAAAARAEAERVRQEAEAKRAAAAELERRQRLTADLRRELAAARTAWSAFEMEVWSAGRAATDARNEARDLRDAPPGEAARAAARQAAAEDFAAWMTRQAAAHPVRQSLERLDTLLRSDDPDAAAAAAQELRERQEQLAREVAETRTAILTLTGTVALSASPGTFDWELTDAFGRVQRGRTPATIGDVAAGNANVRLTREGWPVQEHAVSVRRNETVTLAVDQPVGGVEIAPKPAGLDFMFEDALERAVGGVTPVTLEEVPAGGARLELYHNGWMAGAHRLTVTAGQTLSFRPTVAFGSIAVESEPAGAEVYLGQEKLGVTPLSLPQVPAGKHELQLRKADFKPALVTAEVAAGATASVRAELASALGLEDYPVVWFFRFKRVIGLAMKFQISLNGQPVMLVTNGSYGVFRLPPGRYQLEADPNVGGTLTKTLEFLPNRTYFYRLAPATEFKFLPPPFFEETTEQAARSELHELKGNSTPQLLPVTPLP